MKGWRAYAVVALIAALAVPAIVRAAGTLAIPNVIANQSGPNVAASLLDSNWTTIANYVNNREVAIGVLSSRPAASVSGRWYLASDTSGGTLYVDNGSSWVQAGAGVEQTSGVAGSRFLVAAAASLTTVNASATLVNLRNPSSGAVVTQTATATRTNTITTDGPIANGRDRAGAFSASSWVHFYYIWNGTTLSTLSSACAPSDVNGACSSSYGPVLPTGYTHWTYIGPVYLNASSELVATTIRGPKAYYNARKTVVTAGVATSETAVGLASLTATNALSTRLHVQGDTNVVSSSALTLRFLSGQDYFVFNNVGSSDDSAPIILDMPNVGQTIYYLRSSALATEIYVLGYEIPNGGN